MKNMTLFIVCIAGCWAFSSTPAYGQGFLKKLKQKVEKAVELDEESLQNDSSKEQEENKEPDNRTPNPADKLPKRRIATSSWDEVIAPSKAETPAALLRELPSLPSIESMANPTEEARKTYYRRIVAVDMRVTELDKLYACSDEEMIAYRDKLYEEMAGLTGLTTAELRILEDPNTSDAERQRLGEKTKNAIFGDTKGLEGYAAKIDAAEKQKGRKLTDKEMMQFVNDNPNMMQDMGNLMGKMGELNEKTSAINAKSIRLNQQILAMSDKMAKIRKGNAGVITNCGKIADEYEVDLKAIYQQIYKTDSSQKIDSLYDQADIRMKNYRLRAAKLWRNSLQAELDEVTSMLPDMEKLQKQMVDENMIPACAMRRAPLNIVTTYTDILHKAYANFPQPEVLPVENRPQETGIGKDEYLLIAESGFSSSVDDFIKDSRFYTVNDKGERFLYENGKKRKLNDKDPHDFSMRIAREKPAYGSWTSDSGKRTATYARDGSLTLHDGTTFYPLAFKKEGNKLIWIDFGRKGITRCTYKL